MDHASLLVRNWPVIRCADGMWRSVCHRHKMAGPGYKTIAEAQRYAPLVRHDAEGAKRMAERYTVLEFKP